MNPQKTDQEIGPQEALNVLDAIAQKVNTNREGHAKLSQMVATLQRLIDADKSKAPNTATKGKPK